ncbi:hypothetical protein MTP99_001470 [Tenebrio molitor]|jgi:hypothetical protein|nr:hypothetical protein MTP99_001470 [Tenebrio molitor]
MEETVFVPLEIQEEAKIACLNLLPIKSKDVYEKELQNFNAWKQERGVSGINEEEVILAYFISLQKKCASSSMWTRAGPIPEFQIPILQINASEILFHLAFTSQCKYQVKTIILELN